MEQELLKRETIVKVDKIYSYLSIILFVIAGISLLAYIVVVAIGDYWEQMFDFDDYYVHIFMIAFLFLNLAVIFFFIKNRNVKTSIVLTDKRIYCCKNSEKAGATIKSYNLNKINSYDFYELKNGSILKISTSSSNAIFNIDKEFYEKFVDAINNSK